MSRVRRRVVTPVVALVALLLAVVTACGPGAPTPAGTLPQTTSAPATTEPNTTTAAPLTDEEQIIAAWKHWFETLYAVGSNPTDDQVREAFGPISEPDRVEQVVELFQYYRAEGYAPAGHIVFGSIAVTLEGSAATVVECRVTTTETVVRVSDGVVVTGGDASSRFEGTLVKSQDGAWLMATLQSTEAECA